MGFNLGFKGLIGWLLYAYASFIKSNYSISWLVMFNDKGAEKN